MGLLSSATKIAGKSGGLLKMGKAAKFLAAVGKLAAKSAKTVVKVGWKAIKYPIKTVGKVFKVGKTALKVGTVAGLGALATKAPGLALGLAGAGAALFKSLDSKDPDKDTKAATEKSVKEEKDKKEKEDLADEKPSISREKTEESKYLVSISANENKIKEDQKLIEDKKSEVARIQEESKEDLESNKELIKKKDKISNEMYLLQEQIKIEDNPIRKRNLVRRYDKLSKQFRDLDTRIQENSITARINDHEVLNLNSEIQSKGLELSYYKGISSDLKSGLSRIRNSIVDKLKDPGAAIDKVGDKISRANSKLGTALDLLFILPMLFNFIKKKLLGGITEKIGNLWGGIKTSFSNLFEGGKKVLSAGFNFLPVAILGGVGSIVNKFGLGLTKTLGGALTSVSRGLGSLMTGLSRLSASLMGDALSDLFGGDGLIGKGIDKGKGILGKLNEKVGELASKAKGTIVKGGKIVAKLAKQAIKFTPLPLAAKYLGPVAKVAKGAITGIGKSVAKVASKSAFKSILKKIPLVGVAAGLGFGIDRAIKGDWTGAAMEVASGAASLLDLVAPGAGTATSIAIDAAIAGRDMYKANQAEDEALERLNNASPHEVENKMKEIAKSRSNPKFNSEAKLAALLSKAPNGQISMDPKSIKGTPGDGLIGPTEVQEYDSKGNPIAFSKRIYNPYGDGNSDYSYATSSASIPINDAQAKRNAKLAMDWIVRDSGLGLNYAQAAGIVANWMTESRVNPNINERNPLIPGSRGGYGIAQWTGPRRKALDAWLQSQGKTEATSTLYDQLRFFAKEYRENRAFKLEGLRSMTSPSAAAMHFYKNYEVPPSTDRTGPKRQAYANSLFSEFGNKGVNPPKITPPLRAPKRSTIPKVSFSPPKYPIVGPLANNSSSKELKSINSKLDQIMIYSGTAAQTGLMAAAKPNPTQGTQVVVNTDPDQSLNYT